MDIISLHWHDHPLMTLDWYNGEKERMTDAAIARELDINYSKSAEGIVYPEFKDGHILRKPYQVDPNLDVIRVLDYGKTCAAQFGQKTNFGHLVVFHEIVLINESNPTHKLARAVQAYSANLRCTGFRDHDDPAGSSDNYVNDEETSYKIVQEYGIHPTHNVSIASNRRRINRIEMTKHMLSQWPEGDPLLLIHESCTFTIDALGSGYRHKVDKKTQEVLDEIEEVHPHEDVADCLGMMVMEEFTVTSGNDDHKGRKRQPRSKYTGY